MFNHFNFKTMFDIFEDAFIDLPHDKALKIVDLQRISDTPGTRL